MDELQLGSLVRAESTGNRFAVERRAAFRGHNRTVGVDLLDDGDMAVHRARTELSALEHDNIADMARSGIDPIAQLLRGCCPLGPIAKMGTDR